MTLADKISIVSDLILALGLLPTAIGIWWQQKKTNEDRENGTYDSLDTRYTKFLELCCKYPELEVYDPLRDNWSELDGQQQKKQLILYQILVSLLERAYILYHEKHIFRSDIRIRQWTGWETYMKDYATRPNFRYVWIEKKIGEGMDTGFFDHMQNLIIAEGGVQ